MSFYSLKFSFLSSFFSMKNENLLTFTKSCLKMKHINLLVYQEYKMTQDLPFSIYFEIWKTDIKISRFYNL